MEGETLLPASNLQSSVLNLEVVASTETAGTSMSKIVEGESGTLLDESGDKVSVSLATLSAMSETPINQIAEPADVSTQVSLIQPGHRNLEPIQNSIGRSGHTNEFEIQHKDDNVFMSDPTKGTQANSASANNDVGSVVASAETLVPEGLSQPNYYVTDPIPQITTVGEYTTITTTDPSIEDTNSTLHESINGQSNNDANKNIITTNSNNCSGMVEKNSSINLDTAQTSMSSQLNMEGNENQQDPTIILLNQDSAAVAGVATTLEAATIDSLASPNQKRKRANSTTEKAKNASTTKRKRNAKGGKGGPKTETTTKKGKKSKNATNTNNKITDQDSDCDTDDASDGDDADFYREFSRPSRRSLKNSPEFAKAYANYSKAIQEKKSGEANFEKISKQFEAALQRKENAQKVLLSAKELLYKADLEVHCYWNTMYHKLKAYKEVNGHCMVPYTRGIVTNTEEKKLGAWVHCQRKNYHNYHRGLNSTKQSTQQQSTADSNKKNSNNINNQNRMKPQRIVALEKLGFVWSFFDTKWNQRIKDLEAYKNEHGHLHVPFKYPPNQSLAHWVHNQRRDYNLYQEGKPSQMTIEKINELEALGFAWKSDYPRTKRRLTPDPTSLTESQLWNENYNALAAFHSQHGHCSVNRFTSPNRKLCAWLTWQRKQHKLYVQGQPSQMNPERIKKLNDLGFEWTPRNKPGSGGVVNVTQNSKPSIVVISPSVPMTCSNVDTIQESEDTMPIPIAIANKVVPNQMQVLVVQPPTHSQKDLKLEYHQEQHHEENKMIASECQTADPLNQQQLHLRLQANQQHQEQQQIDPLNQQHLQLSQQCEEHNIIPSNTQNPDPLNQQHIPIQLLNSSADDNDVALMAQI